MRLAILLAYGHEADYVPLCCGNANMTRDKRAFSGMTCGEKSRRLSQGGWVRRAKSKAQSASVPIPDDLRAAFRKAVWSYADWNPELPEPEVTLRDRPYALSAVCGLVDEFHDRLAEDIFDRMMSYLRAIRYTLLRQRLVADHSYAAAGQCFLRLIEDRKRHFLVP